MKRFDLKLLVHALLLAAVFSFSSSEIHAEPYETIINNGDPAKRLDIAVLGDGYTAAQLQLYKTHVASFLASVFGIDPYKEYQRYYNVHRIDITSTQSGADHPERTPAVFVDTAFDAAYNCGNIQRLICVNTSKVSQAIARSLPASHFDVILIIVNDPEYGGSGGSVAVASINEFAVDLVLHEVGHSFGLLADEYAGGGPSCVTSVEPAEPNATRETTRSLIKWNHWIDALTPIPTTSTTNGLPGLYVGSKYCDTGLYRPTYDNIMRSLGRPFEQINTEQHIKRIYNFVLPYDSSEPAGNSVGININRSKQFSVTTPRPFTHNLQVNWFVNGNLAGTGNTFLFSGSAFGPGMHALKATVRDATALVRNDPAQLLTEDRNWTVTVLNELASSPPFDYDGDGRSDISVWRPGSGSWFILQSSSSSVRAQGWGLNGDKLAPADFDGDGKTDLAVFRPSDSNWYIFNSATNTATVAGWGLAGDLPVPADYGGDGKADLAVFRPSEGKWYRRDSDGKLHIYEWGLPGDKPAPADFNGDGVADMTVFRPSEGKWYTINSGNASISEFTWGLNGDLPVPGDYSGDGKSDFAVFRPSNQTWYRIHSDTFQIHIITWGLPGDFPTPGDYDGDGRQDLAVFRPSNSTWFINSSTGGIYSQPFGLAGDVPVENAFVY